MAQLDQKTPYYLRALKEAFSVRVDKNPRYSLRSFATSLAIDPSSLSQILSSKRQISIKVAERICDRLNLSYDSRLKFLESIAVSKVKSGVSRISPKLKSMAQLTEKNKAQILYREEITPDMIRVTSEWYHFAILELTQVKGFRSEPKWIAKRLGITASEAKLAVSRLLELKLLCEKNGSWIKTAKHFDTLNKDITSAAHRHRQAQVLEKSKQALLEVPIEFRNHSSITLPIALDKIPQAKKRITKFMWALAQELSSHKKEAVYELTVNLFPLEKSLENSNE